jgi:aminoglycoside phosphotransferase (APT) family kinase protein
MHLLAQGRDCDIYDLGDGTVLRRSRKAYDQTGEARVLRYTAGHGYPVPAVIELRDDGHDLVMEKIEGPTMAQAVERRPWRAAAIGRQLADLHRSLHQIPAPDWLRALAEGDCLVHLDLHPQNVILSPAGPVVIDWTNAVRGRPGHDSARVWVLVTTAKVDVSPLVRPVLGMVRTRLVDAFLDDAGRQEAVDCLPYAVELTLLDPNISEEEKAAVRELVRRAGPDGADRA